jgi:hypothetical protein
MAKAKKPKIEKSTLQEWAEIIQEPKKGAIISVVISDIDGVVLSQTDGFVGRIDIHYHEARVVNQFSINVIPKD